MEWALRGHTIHCLAEAKPSIQTALDTGRVTPLEAEQAAQHLKYSATPQAVLGCEVCFLDGSTLSLATMNRQGHHPAGVLLVPAADFTRALRLVQRPKRCLGVQLQTGAVTLLYDEVDEDVLPRLTEALEQIPLQVAVQRLRVAVRRPSLTTMTA